MANRQSVTREAGHLADWILRDIGRELRLARLIGGMTQEEVARGLGRAGSHVSRAEHGLIKGIGIHDLSRHGALVGLKLWVRAYPAATRPMDRAQLELFGRFRDRLSADWQIVLEAPMPISGDFRAADALISIEDCRCAVEVITRLADFQAQLRAAQRKVRDLEADRLIFVVAGNTTNRRTLRDMGAAVREAFPLGTKAALEDLAAGRDPGGNALILL